MRAERVERPRVANGRMARSPHRAVAALLVVACNGSPPPSPPGPPVGQDPGFIGQQIAGHTLYLRPGFRIGLFADDVMGVRYLALGPGGVVYASLQSRGVVVRLRDADADGVAEARDTVLQGLDQPFGMAFRGDTLYFAEETTVKRLDPGTTTPVTLISGIPAGGHITRTVVFGPDDLMYVSIGSSCNVCNEPDPRRAAVVRYNRDGTGQHVFATGLRNSAGLAFHPATGELWATNNDRDKLGDDLPPERINILRDGGDYGWPRCYLPGTRNPEYGGADCSTVEAPAITFQAHSAPLGIRFYSGTAYPADYQGDAFMAYHGSWDRTVPTGAKVVRVQVENGRPVSIDDFVYGWQVPDGSRWGRPVDVLPLPDGSMLISDDHGWRVWRVSYGR